jgi:putative SOS response-associated peptidase YedK
MPCTAVSFSLPICCALPGLCVPDSREKSPSYNVAPSQLLYVIHENHDTDARVLGRLRWGLISHGCPDPGACPGPRSGRAQANQRAR